MGIVKSRPVEILPEYDTIGITAANTRIDESREHYSVYSNRASSTSESSDEEESPALQLPDLIVKAYHLSCASDVYRGDNHNYAGFVLYSHDGKNEWDINGKKCKTGFLVIQDTESAGVKRHQGNAPGVVHGAVYKNVFGEDVGNTVGEGFAVVKGEFKWNSGTFNSKEDTYHDNQRKISQDTERCVSEVLKAWMKAGESHQHLPPEREYPVKELLNKRPISF